MIRLRSCGVARRALVALGALGALVAGCEPHDAVDMAPPAAASLSTVEPVDGQVGLRYGERVTLKVRLGRPGQTYEPVAGQELRFSIFGDPRGSTLASDRALTDEQGYASVDLAAGQLEAIFRVAVTSNIAASIEFGVSVSKNQLLAFDVALVPPTGVSATTARALLYMDRTCASLRPQPVPDQALRQLQAVIGAAAPVLEFRNLLAQTYALVGRVDGAAGEILGWGCVDLPIQVFAAQLSAGASVPSLSLQLTPIVPTIAGRFALTGELVSSDSQLERLAPYRDLVHCPLDPAEQLLDELLDELGGDDAALAATLAAERQAPVAGCRPDVASPDQSLAQLLGSGTSAALRAVVADLESLAERARLTTALECDPLDGDTLAGSHRATAIKLVLASGDPVELNLLQSGWFAGAVPLSLARQGDALTSSVHDLPLGLPFLWGVALAASMGDHFPSLAGGGVPDGRALVAVLLDAAQSNDATGCAAIAATLCEMVPDCATAVEAACARLPGRLAPALDGVFAAGPPLRLSITATLKDSDGDLRMDVIPTGTFLLNDGKVVPITGSLLP